MNDRFDRLARSIAKGLGTPLASALAVFTILVWAMAGPVFGWSDSHSLFINTLTTVITYLMVFVLQNTQNRDTEAIQLKLDELLRALDTARTGVALAEDMSEAERGRLRAELRDAARGAS